MRILGLRIFTSLNGPRFYGLKPNSGTVVLKRQPASAIVPVAVDQDEVMGFSGRENLSWSIAEVPR
jgi:dihydroorotase